MKGPIIGYGCLLTQPVVAKDAPIPDTGWLWQPVADFPAWWNDQPAARATFPLLYGGIDTPEYLALVLAVGETNRRDRRDYPCVQQLGNFVLPLDRVSAALGERLSREQLSLALPAWAQVCEDAAARGLTFERQASLLFIYEQDLCEEP